MTIAPVDTKLLSPTAVLPITRLPPYITTPRPNDGIVVVEVRAHRAVVVAEEIIRIAGAAEHGADGMLDREYVGQLHLVIGVERVQRLVERIGLVRDGMAGLFAER